MVFDAFTKNKKGKKRGGQGIYSILFQSLCLMVREQSDHKACVADGWKDFLRQEVGRLLWGTSHTRLHRLVLAGQKPKPNMGSFRGQLCHWLFQCLTQTKLKV